MAAACVPESDPALECAHCCEMARDALLLACEHNVCERCARVMGHRAFVAGGGKCGGSAADAVRGPLRCASRAPNHTIADSPAICAATARHILRCSGRSLTRGARRRAS